MAQARIRAEIFWENIFLLAMLATTIELARAYIEQLEAATIKPWWANLKEGGGGTAPLDHDSMDAAEEIRHVHHVHITRGPIEFLPIWSEENHGGKPANSEPLLQVESLVAVYLHRHDGL